MKMKVNPRFKTVKPAVKNEAPRTRISQTDVPAYSLEQALRIAQAIVDNYGKAPTAPVRVAAALNMTPTSGPFKMLCGAAIAYGLTEGGYNASQISITALAKKILSPTDEGIDLKAKREAFLKPKVFNQFCFKYDGNALPKEDIAKNVLEDLGVPRDRTKDVFDTFLDSAKKLGLIQEIKGKNYLILDGAADLAADSEIINSGRESLDGVAESNLEKDSAAKINSAQTLEKDKILPQKQADNFRDRRVFITHGKSKSFVEPIKKLLQFGELEAVVSVEQQSVSQPVPDKVMNDMRSCGAAIIHVCEELKLIDKEAKEHILLNPNVLIEIGAAMALYGRRFILLVKDGVKLPSNLQGLYEVRYLGENLDGEVTIKLMEAINVLKKTSAYPTESKTSEN